MAPVIKLTPALPRGCRHSGLWRAAHESISSCSLATGEAASRARGGPHFTDADGEVQRGQSQQPPSKGCSGSGGVKVRASTQGLGKVEVLHLCPAGGGKLKFKFWHCPPHDHFTCPASSPAKQKHDEFPKAEVWQAAAAEQAFKSWSVWGRHCSPPIPTQVCWGALLL